MLQDGLDAGSSPRQTLETPFKVFVVVTKLIGAIEELGATFVPVAVYSYPVL